MELFLLACLLLTVFANEKKPNVDIFPFNKPPVSNGLPLPLPKSWTKSDTVFGVRGEGFVFNAIGNTCDDLEGAFDRYHKMMFNNPLATSRSSKKYSFKSMVSK